MAQIPKNMHTMKHKWKENGFQIIKSMKTIHAFLAYVITYFVQVENYVKIINYLPCMVS